MQEIRSSNPPVVTGICDPNKSRARHHQNYKWRKSSCFQETLIKKHQDSKTSHLMKRSKNKFFPLHWSSFSSHNSSLAYQIFCADLCRSVEQKILARTKSTQGFYIVFYWGWGKNNSTNFCFSEWRIVCNVSKNVSNLKSDKIKKETNFACQTMEEHIFLFIFCLSKGNF